MKKENLLKFYQTYRLYIFPGVVAMSSLLLIVFAIFPQVAKLISNQKGEGELISKSKFLESKAEALESYNKEDLARKLEIALAAYPEGKDFGVAIGLLQQIVAQSGFTISSIALGNSSQTSGGSQSYALKMEMIGVKPGLPILINNLESSPRLVRVNNIDVFSAGNLQSINVSLVVQVLYAGLPKSFGSSDSPLPELSQADEDLITKLTGVGGVISQPELVSTPSTPRGKANPFE